MNRLELKHLIKEVISELTSADIEEFKSTECVNKESSGLHGIKETKEFEQRVRNKLATMPKYKNNKKLIDQAAKRIAQLAQSGNKRVTEMWTAWEENDQKNQIAEETNDQIDISDTVSTAQPTDPNLKKLADASKKIADAKREQVKLDGKEADIEKRNAPQVKNIERKQQDVAGKLARASDDAEKAELNKNANKV